MTGHATVGIHDDFTPGQAAVAHWATDNETAGRVDVVFGARAQPFGRQNRLDDLFHHRFLEVFQRDIFGMLSGQHHCVDADDFAVVILESDLAFCVRTQPRQGTVFTDFGLALYQTVRVSHRRRHQHFGFVGGIAKHQALVAGTLFQRIGTVNALIDIRGLLADSAQHGTRVGVKTHIRMNITDFTYGFTGDFFDIYPSAGGDFATDQHHAGFHVGFASYARLRILFQDGVENGIGDLVGNFIGMPFGYGLGRE
ncbi:hypothetical protein D3C79_702590 [compost metagenome]